MSIRVCYRSLSEERHHISHLRQRDCLISPPTWVQQTHVSPTPSLVLRCGAPAHHSAADLGGR